MWGLAKQAAALCSMGRAEDAEQVFDKIFALCHADEQKSLQKLAADAMI